MFKLPILKMGDAVEIIAPATRCPDKRLTDLKELLSSWGLNCLIYKNIFGDDLLCANTDEMRFRSLQNALQNPLAKAVICASGGYGSMRLIPQLTKILPPATPKLFVGMSDMTALLLYFQQQWQWPVIHGAAAIDKFSPESIASLKSILFAEVEEVTFHGFPLNKFAEKDSIIESTIVGGNLSLLQTSIGTLWQVDARKKILLMEEVGERGYRVDRMLEHLQQANIFKDAIAILFGDFIDGREPNQSSLINPVLERFAHSCPIPVVRIAGVGHAHTNFPMPLGTPAKLMLGNKIKLVCSR